jgi:hypothetical protein
MSANNAVFVVPLLWHHPRVIENGVVTEWSYTKQWAVYHGDFDQHGELTRTGKVEGPFLWSLLQHHAELYTTLKAATTGAQLLGIQIPILEYGVQFCDPLLYEEPLTP